MIILIYQSFARPILQSYSSYRGSADSRFPGRAPSSLDISRIIVIERQMVKGNSDPHPEKPERKRGRLEGWPGYAASDLGLARDRHFNMRKSGKPDLRCSRRVASQRSSP